MQATENRDRVFPLIGTIRDIQATLKLPNLGKSDMKGLPMYYQVGCLGVGGTHGCACVRVRACV